MNRLKLASGIALLAFALATVSCKKDSNESLDMDTQSSTDNYLAEHHVNDEVKQVQDAAQNNNLGKAGPTVIIDSTSSPRVMTIDYGTGTVCNDGKLRSGKLVVTWTGRYRDVGTVITITPDNFYQNGNHIEGTKTITNNGRNSSNNLTFSVVVSNAKITTADGKIRTWSATRSREWISGESTPLNPSDDVYLITGSSNGVNANGKTFTSTITQALRFDLSCQYRLTAGEVEVVPEGKTARVVNYGNGACDGSFTVKIGSRTITVNR
jgi:hypothetical protein